MTVHFDSTGLAGPALQTKVYFDSFGRAVPTGLAAPAHQTIRRRFVCPRQPIDIGASYQRLRRHLAPDAGLDAAAFAARIEAALDRLKADSATAPLLNGPHVPFLLPRESGGDIGRRLQSAYLPAVERAYREAYPDYVFKSDVVGDLEGRLTVAPGSRHDQLITAAAGEEAVGIYFPALLEFSAPAAIEFIATLPPNLLLAGGFDTSAAFVAAPGLLFDPRAYPPLLWLSGLAGEKDGIGYHYEAYGYNLSFNRRPHRALVSEYWASGLVALA